MEMPCEPLKQKYDVIREAIRYIMLNGGTPSQADLTNRHNDWKSWTTCMSAQRAIRTIFPLDGVWNAGGQPGPKITATGNYITVDMSAYGRMPADGIILNQGTIYVFFPDENPYGEDHTGQLQSPGRIMWDNKSEWTMA